ncbi:DUF4124 domain-containing protein [Aestuariicella hydrocarbonica]|uniref:DUF4124 domain-containing protein n=1 Tax=Pseudomaricurvus hydrocarbonicus TaxID=1470433 RepID=A0A9E5T537_9GAMM|nr:DUF4124 domain-containing protein [Aestuariicella hydrocarbonica]NHO68567.1 DUF4124 domain-containing protein [Aestuariicella hydrocarbonica]
MKIVHFLLCVSLLGTSLFAAAEIYKSVDEHGNVIYTDNPKGNNKVNTVELPPVNTQPATPVYQRPTQQPSQSTEYQVTIHAPQDGAQIPTGQRDIPVSLNVSPQLKQGAYIQILLNGQVFGSDFHATQFTLQGVYRGEHHLQAVVISASGEELARSDSVTIYVHRASVARPQPRS